MSARLFRNAQSKQVTCKRGHLLEGDNVRYDRHGKRSCVTCRRENCRAYHARHRAEILERHRLYRAEFKEILNADKRAAYHAKQAS